MCIRERVNKKEWPGLGALGAWGLAFAIGLGGPGLALAGEISAEDLTIVFKVTDSEGERTTTQYYTAERARLDQGEIGAIVDFASGRVIRISNQKKMYSETTFEEIELALTWTSAEMEKAMVGIPDSLRSKMMGDAAREVTVTRGAARTVVGVPCQTFTVALSEKTRIETCAASSLVPPFDPRNFRNLALLTAPIGRGNSGMSKLVQRLREIEGFSLASSLLISLFGRKMESTTVATEIRRGPIDDSAFDLPLGYTQVASPFAAGAR